MWKNNLVFAKWFFSFDRSNMQIFTLNITRVVWPHVTTKLVSHHPKSHQNLSLLNFKCAPRIITPGGHIYIRGRVRAWHFENDPNRAIQVPVSYLCGSGNNWCQPLKSTDSKAKNWKIPQIKIPWSMCSRGSSQIIKIVLVVLISGVLLSEKHPKTYLLGLWFLWPLKGTTSILTHFRSPSPPRSAPKNKGLPPSEKKRKKVICLSRPRPQKCSVPNIPFS